MMQSGVLADGSFSVRAEIEWRLYHRERFAPEHRNVGVATLERLDAMFERLSAAQSIEESIAIVKGAFATDNETRVALVPLLGLLYPLAFFDDKTPTEDIVRLIAHHERRKALK